METTIPWISVKTNILGDNVNKNEIDLLNNNLRDMRDRLLPLLTKQTLNSHKKHYIHLQFGITLMQKHLTTPLREL